MKQLKNIKQM